MTTQAQKLREIAGEWRTAILEDATTRQCVLMKRLLAFADELERQESTHALVPLRHTRAMNDVMYEENWRWEDLLAAAEAVTEEQYGSAKETLTFSVLSITTAYEHGFGQALRDDARNPYVAGSLEAEAWDHGREVGKQKQAAKPAVRIYWHGFDGWQVDWLGEQPNGGQSNYFYAAQPVAQEPTAWFRIENGARVYYEAMAWPDLVPLYAAPRTEVKMLTDEQLCTVARRWGFWDDEVPGFRENFGVSGVADLSRAVITEFCRISGIALKQGDGNG